MACTLQKQYLGTAEVNSPTESEYFWSALACWFAEAGRSWPAAQLWVCPVLPVHPIASTWSSARSRVAERNEPGPDDLWPLQRTAVPSLCFVTRQSRGQAVRALCFRLCCSSVVPAPPFSDPFGKSQAARHSSVLCYIMASNISGLLRELLGTLAFPTDSTEQPLCTYRWKLVRVKD